MEITEVRIFSKEGADKKLKAYATVTFDNCFVVRNVKIIEGNKGLFVAMPSRKLREACPKCGFRNALRSKFCNLCGSSVPISEKKPQTEDERLSEHRDIAHPITPECREYIQNKVIEAFNKEFKNGPAPAEAQKQPPRPPRPVSNEPVRHEPPRPRPVSNEPVRHEQPRPPRPVSPEPVRREQPNPRIVSDVPMRTPERQPDRPAERPPEPPRTRDTVEDDMIDEGDIEL